MHGERGYDIDAEETEISERGFPKAIQVVFSKEVFSFKEIYGLTHVDSRGEYTAVIKPADSTKSSSTEWRIIQIDKIK